MKTDMLTWSKKNDQFRVDNVSKQSWYKGKKGGDKFD